MTKVLSFRPSKGRWQVPAEVGISPITNSYCPLFISITPYEPRYINCRRFKLQRLCRRGYPSWNSCSGYPSLGWLIQVPILFIQRTHHCPPERTCVKHTSHHLRKQVTDVCSLEKYWSIATYPIAALFPGRTSEIINLGTTSFQDVIIPDHRF